MPFPAAPFLSAVSFSSALFLSLLALPRLGVFVAMFAGVPIIMAQLRYPAVLLGTGAMVTSGGVIFLFASLLKTTMPGLAVLLYIGLCGLPALVVASLIRRGSPPLMIILSGAFQIVFFLGGIAFLLYEKTSGELWTALSKSLHQAVLIVMNTAIQNAQTTLTPDEKTRLMALEPMIYRSGSDNPDPVGRLPGKIDDAPGNKGPSVIHKDIHGAFVGQVCHANFCPQRKRSMGSRQVMFMKNGSTGRLFPIKGRSVP